MFSKKATKFEVNLPYFLMPAILLMSMSKQCWIFFSNFEAFLENINFSEKTSFKKMKEIFNKMWETQK